jgi:penicillin-binding protein 2
MTEGTIGLARAIARSTDTFFYKIGEMVGPDNIAKWAETFGLNKQTEIDIPGETKGLIPSPDWKKETLKENWFLGDTYHMAIGQGYVALTPVELNTFITSIAANGNLCKPRFNQEIPAVCKKIGVSQDNLNLVKDGMKQACAQGGTAQTFFNFPDTYGGTEVACKTGTAEVEIDGKPHAWFTFFAPIEKPEIVMTVLVERGGQGSSVAGPIARKIADFYFQGLKQ